MLEYSITVKLLTEHHLEFLSLKGGCTGSSESTHVKMPHCWKSRATMTKCNISRNSMRTRPAVLTNLFYHMTSRLGMIKRHVLNSMISHTFVEIDHEIISTDILRVVVRYMRKYIHEVLVRLSWKKSC